LIVVAPQYGIYKADPLAAVFDETETALKVVCGGIVYDNIIASGEIEGSP
jgi:hypothetical protein